MYYFLFLFRIFATAFTVVELSDHAYAARSDYDYDLVQPVDCKAERRQLISTMLNTTCKPYDRYVALKPGPSHEFHPAVVSVKQCDGNCPGHTCTPTKTRMIKLTARRITRHTNGHSNVKCVLVQVEEHVKCRCMCRQREMECTEKQVFLKSRCACICKNQEYLKMECEANKGLWDDHNCRCDCMNVKDIGCRGSLKWNPDNCKCM